MPCIFFKNPQITVTEEVDSPDFFLAQKEFDSLVLVIFEGRGSPKGMSF